MDVWKWKEERQTDGIKQRQQLLYLSLFYSKQGAFMGRFSGEEMFLRKIHFSHPSLSSEVHHRLKNTHMGLRAIRPQGGATHQHFLQHSGNVNLNRGSFFFFFSAH